MDFAMNYACEYQNEVQSALWSRESVMLFTAAVILNGQVDTYIICSDSNDKGKHTVLAFIDSDLGYYIYTIPLSFGPYFSQIFNCLVLHISLYYVHCSFLFIQHIPCPHPSSPHQVIAFTLKRYMLLFSKHRGNMNDSRGEQIETQPSLCNCGHTLENQLVTWFTFPKFKIFQSLKKLWHVSLLSRQKYFCL